MKKHIKKIVSLAAVATITMSLLAGCGDSSGSSGDSASSGDKGELNIFNWTEYIPDSVVQEFEDEYGIKVNYSTYSSNEECLAKVQSSAEGTYDLVVPSDYMVTIMKEKGLLEELDKDKITNLGNIYDSYLNQSYDPGNKYSIPFDTGSVVIAVNKDTVKDSITSYKDLIKPEYKNSIVALDDQRVMIGIALKALGYSLNEVDDSKLAQAKDFLTKLTPNIKSFDSDTPKTALITGEASVGVIWNAEAALANQEKSNIDVVYPKEGMYKFIDNFAIPKGAKNKENAELFINFILRPEINKEIVESYPYTSVNKAAKDMLPDTYTNSKASNIPTDEMDKGEFVKDLGDATAKYDKIWSEIKK